MFQNGDWGKSQKHSSKIQLDIDYLSNFDDEFRLIEDKKKKKKKYYGIDTHGDPMGYTLQDKKNLANYTETMNNLINWAHVMTPIQLEVLKDVVNRARHSGGSNITIPHGSRKALFWSLMNYPQQHQLHRDMAAMTNPPTDLRLRQQGWNNIWSQNIQYEPMRQHVENYLTQERYI